jgi:hypothetical protein
LVTPGGSPARAWDYKQKKSLVIVFLDAQCAACDGYLDRLVVRAKDFEQHNAVVLVICPDPPTRPRASGSSGIFVLGGDPGRRGARAYLGDRERLGVFLADRYGELKAQWVAESEAKLPGVEEILGWLAQIEMACEECGAPHWPVES